MLVSIYTLDIIVYPDSAHSRVTRGHREDVSGVYSSDYSAPPLVYRRHFAPLRSSFVVVPKKLWHASGMPPCVLYGA